MKKLFAILLMLSASSATYAAASKGEEKALIEKILVTKAVFEAMESALSVGTTLGRNGQGWCSVTYEKVIGPGGPEDVLAIRVQVDLNYKPSAKSRAAASSSFILKDDQALVVDSLAKDNRYAFRLDKNFVVLMPDPTQDNAARVVVGQQGAKATGCSIPVKAELRNI